VHSVVPTFTVTELPLLTERSPTPPPVASTMSSPCAFTVTVRPALHEVNVSVEIAPLTASPALPVLLVLPATVEAELR
jgi:hypothetical protein